MCPVILRKSKRAIFTVLIPGFPNTGKAQILWMPDDSGVRPERLEEAKTIEK